MEPIDPFKLTQTYDELIAANLAFLRGEITRTPYHLGPVSEETRPLLDKLIRINAHGFVSTNGQPGNLRTGYNAKQKWYYAIRQKPYITGFLPGAYLDAFIAFMATPERASQYDYRLYTVREFQKTIAPSWWTRITDTLTRRETPPTVINKVELVFSRATNPDVIVVTEQKSSSALQKLAKEEWDAFTVFPSVNTPPPMDFTYASNINALKQVSAVYVEIVGNTFETGSTEDLLLAFFDKSQK